MQRVNFELGETRYVRLLIAAANNQEFLILHAGYELVTQAGEVETTGDCIIDGHIIMALISPRSSGRYKVKISYKIGDEDLIEVIEVVVV